MKSSVKKKSKRSSGKRKSIKRKSKKQQRGGSKRKLNKRGSKKQQRGGDVLCDHYHCSNCGNDMYFNSGYIPTTCSCCGKGGLNTNGKKNIKGDYCNYSVKRDCR